MGTSECARPTVAGIRIYPIKSLDPTGVEAATLGGETGALVGDREYALVDEDGEYVNGKRTAAVHRVRSDVHGDVVTLSRAGEKAIERSLSDQRDDVERWLSAHFEEPVSLIRDARGGFPDDTVRPGPTVISTGTVREVASWYDGIDPEGVRRRFRANLEIDGVPAFWEDRLVADEGEVVRFRIGDVRIEGVSPCSRCVVPSRDPDTGEERPGFRETFIEHRERTKPPWLDSDRFDHPFRLMVNTRVPRESRGERIAVGDPVAVEDVRPA